MNELSTTKPSSVPSVEMTETEPGDQLNKQGLANREANHKRATVDMEFAAFLRLPDVSEDDDPANLNDMFVQCFMGSYADMDEALRCMTGIGQVEQAIALAGDPITEAVVHIEYGKAEEMLLDHADFIWLDGVVYVFNR